MLHLLLSFSTPMLCLVGALLFAIFLVGQYLSGPLRSVPGPFLAKFTRAWYLWALWMGDFELRDIEYHRKYGAIWRVAPGEYSVDDPESAKTIYGHGSTFVKSPWYSAWAPPSLTSESLFSHRDPHYHALQRRKVSSFYSMSSLISHEPAVNDCISLLSARLSEIAKAGKTIDLQHYLRCYAFDVIGEITFGSRFGFLEQGEDKMGIFKALEERNAYGTYFGVFPAAHRIVFPSLPKTGGLSFLGDFTSRQISQRQEEPKSDQDEGPADMMTKVLRAHEADPEMTTFGDLVTTCRSNIGAGSDTTAISLSSIFYQLMKNPAVCEKLREEINLGLEQGRISSPITFKEAQSLIYLQAIIKESLRIHPATGLPLQRIVPPSVPLTIAGYPIPPGSSVGINSWVAHQNTAVFGSDAHLFRPERWLEFEEQGRGGEVEKYFMAFGLGSRTCIGKNISLLEISKLVPEMVRKFEFVLGEGVEEVGGEGRVRGLRGENRWFVKQLGFIVEVRRREK
ncbi:cytochrome P450 [Amylocarpus encephaloides]|uniref:Cytochrome P450 n=1 Tax=Amylocarpus encephaloides TaxID=45428 RepID=A0A9P8C8D0_9HELO|nr:cytochrome P450 [Amylocarpus encephaloides]